MDINVHIFMLVKKKKFTSLWY